MRQSIAVLSVLATAAFAQGTTVDFFLPGANSYEGPEPVASIIEANPSTTVMNLACPTNSDSTECGFGAGYVYSIVSTTIYEATMFVDEVTMTVHCDHNIKADEMACSLSVEYDGVNEPIDTSTVLSGTDIAFITATVTAGADLLSAAETGAAVISDTIAPTPSSASTLASASTFASASASTLASSATKASSTGIQTTASSTPTPLASGVVDAEGPAIATGAAFRFGVDGSVLLALAGAAAVNMW